MLMHDSAVLDEEAELGAAVAPVPRHLAASRRISSHLIRGTAHSALRWSVRTWIGVDGVVAAGAMAFGHALSPYRHAVELTYNPWLAAAVYAAVLVAWNCVLGLYDRHNLASATRVVGLPAVSCALALASTTLLYGWLDYSHIGRYVLIDTFWITSLTLALVRLVARESARRARIRVLFVGDRSRFRQLETELASTYGTFYDRPRCVEVRNQSGAEASQELLRAVRDYLPDEVVVEDDDATILGVLRQAPAILARGSAIYSYGDYYEELLRQIPVDTIDHRGVLGNGLRVNGPAALVKRPLDVLLAAVGLAVGAPVMLVVAALVKLTSRGPVIYSQWRVGRFGRTFRIYKFRTMCQDAEANGAVWAQQGDCRVTPVGRVLRKTRLDELPQLWNILIGDMSLVGPRPERPEFVADLARQVPHYDLRHLVPPGLTGWAQVSYPYGASVEDAQRKLAYDLYYVRHAGVAFDVIVCLRTVVAMLKGAR
jgi:exopolysaccharide biosynthesis polyprenyl glycosylphosphotransferase